MAFSVYLTGRPEYMNGVQPGFDERGPVGDRKRRGTKAVAVASFGVDVKLGRNLELLEGLEVDQDILFVDRIVFGLKQKGGRGVGARIDAARKLSVRGRFDEIAGIDGDDEVGTCADGSLAGRLIGALEIRMVAEDDYEMASGREAEDTDAIGFEMPLGRVGSG